MKILQNYIQNINLKKENDISKLEAEDILVFNLFKNENIPHFGIFLGNGYYLHHPRNGNSQITTLTENIIKKLVCFLKPL